jgi:hypothetical protein
VFREPVSLIDETVENLQLLAELFGDEIDSMTHGAAQTPSIHRCREARAAIVALLPKLQAARETQRAPLVLGANQSRPYCLDCD